MFTFPHSQGSIPLPLGLEGPSPREEMESSRLGLTFPCLRKIFCFCSAVKPSAAFLTVWDCSLVRGFLYCKDPSLHARLRFTVVQLGYSTLSGVSTSLLELSPSSPLVSSLQGIASGTLGSRLLTGIPEGLTSFSLRGEGGRKATASLYNRTGPVGSEMGVVPSS